MNCQLIGIDWGGGRDGDDRPYMRLQVTLDGVPYTILIPQAAIANRQRVYGLPTAEAALHAILREHCKRLNDLPDGNEHTDPRINAMGGLRADVDIAVAPEALAALDQVLAGL